jgi:glycosyltransferase involved in cell wall biosynthesis
VTHSPTPRPSLVLITPARNEATNLPRLIEVMIGQTLRPAIWLIVNDGSTDETEAIVRAHVASQPWMRLVSLSATRERSFAAKATCFMEGYRQLPLDADLIGNLDADVSFDSDYLEFLVDRFAEDRTLGVAGTPFTEPGYDSTKDSFEGDTHVAGGCQLFRRECFDQIGGYKPSRIGVDWVAVTTARYKGWRTRSFREKVFRHHRPLGTAGRSRLRAAFFYGEKDHILGWHPLYELARVTFQTARDPVAGACIAAGYFSAAARRLPRAVSPEVATFHRAEQITKLRAIAQRVLLFRRLDPFTSQPDREM